MTIPTSTPAQPPAQPHLMFSLGYHAEITRAVGQCYVNAGWLDSDQLDDVVFHNLETDFVGFFRSSYHYDNCCFQRGSARVRDLQARVARIGNRRAHRSLEHFGGILHTVQDFYSHSNWVELNNSASPLPIWDLDPNYLPAGIVSGYVWWEPHDCSQHIPNVPTHAELNKDAPDSLQGGTKVGGNGPNKDKTYFELALEAATAATLDQFCKYFGVCVTLNFTIAELAARIAGKDVDTSIVEVVHRILEAEGKKPGRQRKASAP